MNTTQADRSARPSSSRALLLLESSRDKYFGDKTGMFCLEDQAGAAASPLWSRARMETPASSPILALHVWRKHRIRKHHSPWMLEAPFIQPPNPSLEVRLPAVSTYLRDAEGNWPTAKGSRNKGLYVMPLLSQQSTIDAVSQILRTSLALVA